MSPFEWFAFGVIVFVAAAAYDMACAGYTIAAADRRAAHAAVWSAVTYLIGLIGLVSVLRVSTWLVLPEACGLMLGTYLGVRRQ